MRRREPPATTSPVDLMQWLLCLVNRWAARYLIGQGVLLGVIGLSWLGPPTPSRMDGIGWVEFVEPWMIGGSWIAAGVLAVAAGLTRHQALSRLAWAMLISVPGISGAYFAVGWWLALAGLADGAPRGWITAASYLAYSIASWCVAQIATETGPLAEAWEDA